MNQFNAIMCCATSLLSSTDRTIRIVLVSLHIHIFGLMLFNDLVMKLSILTHLLTRLCVSLLGGARPGAGRPSKLSKYPQFAKRIKQHQTEKIEDVEQSNLVHSVDLAHKQNDDIQKELNQCIPISLFCQGTCQTNN